MAYPAFRLYFWGALARGIALWMTIVALPWAAVELGAGPAGVATIVSLQYLPALGVAPLGGVIADRYRRVRVLQATQAAVMMLGCIVAALVVSGAATVPVLAGVALLSGVVTAIDLPVRQAFMADLVPETDLASAASLHSTAWNTSRFLGPGVAGLVIALVGLPVAFLLSAALLSAVVISYSALAARLPHEQTRDGVAPAGLRSLREAMRAVAVAPALRRAFLLGAAGHLLGAQVFQSLAPTFVADVLRYEGGEYGLFMGMWGFGAVIASYVVTVFAHDRHRWMVAGAVGIAVGLATLGMMTHPILAFATAALIGFMQIVLAQNAVVAVQTDARGQMRGRVLGVYASVLHGASPVGALVAGAIAELAGVRAAMLWAAAALVAIAGAVTLLDRWRGVQLPVGGVPDLALAEGADEPVDRRSRR